MNNTDLSINKSNFSKVFNQKSLNKYSLNKNFIKATYTCKKNELKQQIKNLLNLYKITTKSYIL